MTIQKSEIDCIRGLYPDIMNGNKYSDSAWYPLCNMEGIFLCRYINCHMSRNVLKTKLDMSN